MTPLPVTVFSWKTCWMPRHKVRKAHLVDIDPLRDLRYALRARYVLRTRYALWGERDLYHIELQSNISNLSKGKYIDFAKQKYRQKGEYLWISIMSPSALDWRCQAIPPPCIAMRYCSLTNWSVCFMISVSIH